MTLVPGTVMEDGTINRTVPVAGTAVLRCYGSARRYFGSGYSRDIQEKDWAWEFLKW